MPKIEYSEPMHRIKYTKLTKDEIDKRLIPAAAGFRMRV